MTKHLNIAFDDLTNKAKLEVLKFYGIKDPLQANFETCPLFILEHEEEREENEDDCNDEI